MSSPDRGKLKPAMKLEIESLKQLHTWEVVKFPPGRKLIQTQWVFDNKFEKTGEVSRYKARLVAKGFTQLEGIDFH